MAAQAGKDLLIKVNTAAAPTTYTAAAGIRSTSISFNATTIDTTSADSAGRWRELLAADGVKSCDISGSGVFVDGAADEDFRKHFFDGTTPGLQIIDPDFGTYEGDFRITALERSGEHDGEVTYSISLASAGEITFTAA